jgi:hypothetical protein
MGFLKPDWGPFNTIMTEVVEKFGPCHIFLTLSVLRYRFSITTFNLLF